MYFATIFMGWIIMKYPLQSCRSGNVRAYNIIMDALRSLVWAIQ